MLFFPFRIRGEREMGAGHGHQRHRTKPRIGVEPLEGRALLSTVTVHVVNNAFNPSPITIHLGDTVHWVWDGGPHSTTSVNGQSESWDSGVHNPGFTFDHTFTHAGSFAYFCTIHGVITATGPPAGCPGWSQWRPRRPSNRSP